MLAAISVFIELANLLSKRKLFDYIYLICGRDKSHIAKKIISDSKKHYFIDCSEWKVPWLPVNPWQITLVFLSINIDIYFIASTIFFAASSKFSAEINFNPEVSNILFPSL